MADSESESVPSDVEKIAQSVIDFLLPEKSRQVYEQTYALGLLFYATFSYVSGCYYEFIMALSAIMKKTNFLHTDILTMTANIHEIEKLVELFSACNGDQVEDDPTTGNSRENSIQCSSNENASNTEKSSKTKQGPYAKIEPPKRKEILDPEADDSEALYFDETSTDVGQKDWKKAPKWDIFYRQSVTASDMFLGMGFKTPATASCEYMVVSINLPGENRQNIDLKIESENLTLTSPKFLLELKLPHPVDPKRGDAQFDKEGEKLIVTLIMDRELDILNF